MTPGALASVLRVSRRGNRSLPVQRAAERVDDAPEESLADGSLENAAGAADLVSLLHLLGVAEQGDADALFLQVEDEPVHVVPERRDLRGHRAVEPVDVGNSVPDLRDDADLLRLEVVPEAPKVLLQDRRNVVFPRRHAPPDSPSV